MVMWIQLIFKYTNPGSVNFVFFIGNLLIHDLFYVLCYYDETSFEPASNPGVKYYRNEYEKPGEQNYL